MSDLVKLKSKLLGLQMEMESLENLYENATYRDPDKHRIMRSLREVTIKYNKLSEEVEQLEFNDATRV